MDKVKKHVAIVRVVGAVVYLGVLLPLGVKFFPASVIFAHNLRLTHPATAICIVSVSCLVMLIAPLVAAGAVGFIWCHLPVVRLTKEDRKLVLLKASGLDQIGRRHPKS